MGAPPVLRGLGWVVLARRLGCSGRGRPCAPEPACRREEARTCGQWLGSGAGAVSGGAGSRCIRCRCGCYRGSGFPGWCRGGGPAGRFSRCLPGDSRGKFGSGPSTPRPGLDLDFDVDSTPRERAVGKMGVRLVGHRASVPSARLGLLLPARKRTWHTGRGEAPGGGAGRSGDREIGCGAGRWGNAEKAGPLGGPAFSG